MAWHDRTVRRRRRHRHQARPQAAERRADRLGGRRLHPRRRRARADVGAGHGDPAQRHGPRGDRALDQRDDRQRRADGLLRRCRGPPPTSTPPAASATRSRCRSRPLVAACGVAVPQLSGRGLGHTGGTLDKLESIPGWNASLSNDAMMAQLDDVGAVICAAGSGLAPGGQEALRAARRHRHRRGDPADRQLDHEQEDRRGHRRARARRQGRVGRVHEGAKTRPGSWPRPWSPSAPTPASRPSRCSPTCRTPLGLTAGNAIEVAESVEVLAGGGPADVVELTLALAREMLAAAGKPDVDPAEALADGRGDGRLAADDRRPGRRPRRAAAAGAGVARRHRAGRRHADPSRRAGRRRGGLAAGRRAVATGRAGAGRAPVSCCTPSPATRSPRERR